MDASAYHSHLAALLPTGLPWPREPAAVLQRLLQAWADELARVDARVLDLLNEADPRTTTELLTDWERAYGMPDQCNPAVPTEAQRHAAILARLTDLGIQTPLGYRALALSFDVYSKITEYQPYDVTMSVAAPWYDTAWAYAWRIDLDTDALAPGVDPPAVVPLLTCLIARRQPAHTVLVPMRVMDITPIQY